MIVDVAIKKAQLNALYELLNKYGIQPTLCSLETTDESAVITYEPLNCSITVTHNPTDSNYADVTARYLSEPFNKPRYIVLNNSVQWYALGRVVETWAVSITEYEKRKAAYDAKVAAEEAIPDLWALSRTASFTSGETLPITNLAFTQAERDDIANGLRKILHEVKANDELTTENMACIEQHLTDLQEASERVGRKDWKMMFTGVITTMLVTDAIPPDVVQRIYATIITGLGHLFGIGGPPLYLP
jgi:hypothetical protein